MPEWVCECMRADEDAWAEKQIRMLEQEEKKNA